MQGKRRRPRAANNRGDAACLETGAGFYCANRASPARGAANNRSEETCLEVKQDRLFGWKQSELWR